MLHTRSSVWHATLKLKSELGRLLRNFGPLALALSLGRAPGLPLQSLCAKPVRALHPSWIFSGSTALPRSIATKTVRTTLYLGHLTQFLSSLVLVTARCLARASGASMRP